MQLCTAQHLISHLSVKVPSVGSPGGPGLMSWQVLDRNMQEEGELTSGRNCERERGGREGGRSKCSPSRYVQSQRGGWGSTFQSTSSHGQKAGLHEWSMLVINEGWMEMDAAIISFDLNWTGKLRGQIDSPEPKKMQNQRGAEMATNLIHHALIYFRKYWKLVRLQYVYHLYSCTSLLIMCVWRGGFEKSHTVQLSTSHRYCPELCQRNIEQKSWKNMHPSRH